MDSIYRAGRGLAVVLAFVVTVVSGTAAALAHDIPAGFKGFADPAGCGSCHQEIYKEWEGSMHAKSSKFSDGLHGAVADAFAAAMEAKGGKGSYFCANCHTPTADNMAALIRGDAAPDPENLTDTRGVTCSFCHTVDSVVPGERFNTYRVSEGIKGSSGASNAPHGATKWVFEETYEMCLGCHGKMMNAKGGVVCSMEEEGITDCLTCHMETVEGAPASGSGKTKHAYHGMQGGHDQAMLKRGATVSLGADKGVLTVILNNPNQHYFPSTNPLRMAYVKVVVAGADGKTLFTNFDKAPTEDPQAVLIKVFKAGDQVGVPSWEAEGVARDTRLTPGETRTITYKLPEGAANVKATLYYRFAPPMAIEKFNVKPDGTVEKPHVVSETALTL